MPRDSIYLRFSHRRWFGTPNRCLSLHVQFSNQIYRFSISDTSINQTFDFPSITTETQNLQFNYNQWKNCKLNYYSLSKLVCFSYLTQMINFHLAMQSFHLKTLSFYDGDLETVNFYFSLPWSRRKTFVLRVCPQTIQQGWNFAYKRRKHRIKMRGRNRQSRSLTFSQTMRGKESYSNPLSLESNSNVLLRSFNR